MSSGSLPLATYHRTEALGSGSYGSVLRVYDDDGTELALKLFDEDDESDESDDDDDDASSCDGDGQHALGVGTLREISVLRLLRGSNAHRNVITIHDVQPPADAACGEEDGGGHGAGTSEHVGLAMPLFPLGTLSDAVESTRPLGRAAKVKIAHGILSAVQFLHANGFIHRDIKGDNIMLRAGASGPEPVLIDFSLAKLFRPERLYRRSPSVVSRAVRAEAGGDTHTPSMGTPTYKAPEVAADRPYGLPSDLYSVGVVLLELLRGRALEATKDGAAQQLVAEEAEALPDQPYANLVRGLLAPDPEKRLTAREALESGLFAKFGLDGDRSETCRTVDVAAALPLEDGDDDDDDGRHDENHSCNSVPPSSSRARMKKNGVSPHLLRRCRLIRKISGELDGTHPLTVHAALAYSFQLGQLEDVDDLKESQALVDCVVLAHKFFEAELWSTRDLKRHKVGCFKDCGWDAETYRDNEATIFNMMDFCLLPRRIYEWADKLK